jgi:hypothetical protein
VPEQQWARQRADRARALTLRMAVTRDRPEPPPPPPPPRRPAGPDAAAVPATYHALAELSAALYADPDWKRFPWWRRAIYAVSWRPFLALERQFFVKPRLAHGTLLAHLHQSADAIGHMRRVIDAQEEQIGRLSERVRALEDAAARGADEACAETDRPRTAR